MKLKDLSTSVLFAGVGGQGIILASKILAHCALRSGYQVKESEIHGMAQRGGSVTSHVRFGANVCSPLIPGRKADYLVALEELEGLRQTGYLKPAGTVILNRRKIPTLQTEPPAASYPENVEAVISGAGYNVVGADAFETARQIGNPRVENMVLLGILSRCRPFKKHIWKTVISAAVPAATRELNLDAFNRGRNTDALKRGGKTQCSGKKTSKQ